MSFNPFDLLKNASGIQQQLEKAQAELSAISATGASGGGLVKLTINGRMEITQLQLDPIAVDARDVAMLQDLIIAAHRDAISKVQSVMAEKLGPMMGGLNIPGLNLSGK